MSSRNLFKRKAYRCATFEPSSIWECLPSKHPQQPSLCIHALKVCAARLHTPGVWQALAVSERQRDKHMEMHCGIKGRRAVLPLILHLVSS